LDEVDGQLIDVFSAGLTIGLFGNDRSGVDDMIDSVRDADLLRTEKIAINEFDVEPVQKMEVGGPSDQAVHIPAFGQEVTAKVRPDESVGAGNEYFHGVLIVRRSTAAFHRRMNGGAARMQTAAARTPMKVSVT
jgi:hypothetical protein